MRLGNRKIEALKADVHRFTRGLVSKGNMRCRELDKGEYEMQLKGNVNLTFKGTPEHILSQVKQANL